MIYVIIAFVVMRYIRFSFVNILKWRNKAIIYILIIDLIYHINEYTIKIHRQGLTEWQITKDSISTTIYHTPQMQYSEVKISSRKWYMSHNISNIIKSRNPQMGYTFSYI